MGLIKAVTSAVGGVVSRSRIGRSTSTVILLDADVLVTKGHKRQQRPWRRQ